MYKPTGPFISRSEAEWNQQAQPISTCETPDSVHETHGVYTCIVSLASSYYLTSGRAGGGRDRSVERIRPEEGRPLTATEPASMGQLRQVPLLAQNNTSTCTDSRVVNHPDVCNREAHNLCSSGRTWDHPGTPPDRFSQEPHGPSGSHVHFSGLVTIRVKTQSGSAKSRSYENVPS